MKEWSNYLIELYGLHQYFKKCIVSGNIHMRKPESRIFTYAVDHIQCNPHECFEELDKFLNNLRKEDQVLLVRHTYGGANGKLLIPGGFCHENELRRFPL